MAAVGRQDLFNAKGRHEAGLFLVVSEVLREVSEVVVDADLSAVDRDGAGRHAARNHAREVGLAAEAAVKILSFDRPFRRDHHLDADDAAGAVEQELVEGKARLERN
jgi:hypothetical protein